MNWTGRWKGTLKGVDETHHFLKETKAIETSIALKETTTAHHFWKRDSLLKENLAFSRPYDLWIKTIKRIKVAQGACKMENR